MNNEIIVDNFAGGGGASTGIEMAIGRSVDIAINHDPNAVAMHATNHPNTLHYCESVFTVKSKIVTAGRPVALAWYSPDCRHFSKAKGAKPVEKSIRGLAWIELRWGLEVKPRVMMLENVGEFRTWGPLLAGEMRPDPERVGETFKAFVGMLTTGISPEHPALTECCEFLNISLDSEDATRLVNGLGYTVEYRELRACDYGAPTIRKRFFMVARCDGQPVVWPEPTHGDPKSEAVKSGRLKPWRTAAECIDWSIPTPSIFERKKPLAENTLRRIARGIQRFVIDSEKPYIVPFIVKCNHTSSKSEYKCFRGQGLPEPLQTITKKHGYAVAVPHLTKFRTGATGQNVTAPAPTITAGSSTRPGGNGHALGIVETALTPFLAGNGGSEYQAKPRPLDKPAHTVTTGNHHAILASHLVKLRGTCRDGQRVDESMPTVTAGGLHVGNIETSLAVDEYDEERAQQVLAFLRKYCGEDCTGLVNIGGVIYHIVDIGMRMLQPRELYRAQGFPDWYVIEHDFRGVKYAKDKQVARCGNAVPPQFAEALVRANLPELCVQKSEEAA
ncbi:DNA cytosine methyltransferase [Salmonella enterica subsp. enterica serovar Enteritidis]|nr:DNA cytosine methyltransferase [Salmonella enterica subsp. enterica serovar Enteritidis]